MEDKKTTISEPPKFNLDDIPEPPKLESLVPETHEKEIEVPPPAPNAAAKSEEIKSIPQNAQDAAKPGDIPPPPKLEQDIGNAKPMFEIKKSDVNKLDPKSPEESKAGQKKGIFLGLFKAKKKTAMHEATFSEPPKLKNADIAQNRGMMDIPALAPVANEPKVNAQKNEPGIPLPLMNEAKSAVKDGSTVKIESLKLESKAPVSPITSAIPEPPKFSAPTEIKSEIPLPPIIEVKSGNAAPLKLENEIKESVPSNDVPIFQIEEDWVKEGEDYQKGHPEIAIPLTEVEGIGPKREKILKRAGIKSAQHLARHDHKKIAAKLKIPNIKAKKIVTHAKKISSIKTKLQDFPKEKKSENISDVIKELETERKAIERLSDTDSDEKIVELEGHKEVVKVLQQLEKKRNDLTKLQEELAQKESKLTGHEDSYKRDMEYIDNLKRRLDHDVRERTQYLVNLEKEYFQRAQKLAKMQSELEIKERDLSEREKDLVLRESQMKKKLNSLEDRQITVVSKEKKLNKIMEQLDKQDIMLKEKEEDLVKREAEYLKKLDTLESHEKAVLKSLQEKRSRLEKKEKEIQLKEERIHKKERNVDKQSVAVEYAKNVIDEEKGKLIDDEFEQYLHDQLRGNSNLKSSININDLNTVQRVNVINFDDKSTSKLIDACRDMLSANKVNEAKVYYNQLRDKYYSMSFNSQQEKLDLHNKIRQLYDEINLAEISH